MPDYLGKYYKYDDVERLIQRLGEEGYECKDVGGSTPDYRETITIEGQGKWFTYIRCRGPDCSVHEYLCLRLEDTATVRRVGYEYRQDSIGGSYSWDETYEYSDGAKKRVNGGHDYNPPANRLEKIPATKLRDVRDLYPM